MINLKKTHSDFPILKTRYNGQSLVYLDNAATSLTPNQVVKKMNEYYEKYNANIHRGIYKMSEKATLEYDSAREKIRKFINAERFEEIIFTRNATESINLVANT